MTPAESVRPRLDLAAARRLQPDLSARPLSRRDTAPFVVVQAAPPPLTSAVQLCTGPVAAGTGTTEFREVWTATGAGRLTTLDVRVNVSDWFGQHHDDVARVDWRVRAHDLRRKPGGRPLDPAVVLGHRFQAGGRTVVPRGVAGVPAEPPATDEPLASGSAAWGKPFFSIDLTEALADVRRATLTIEAELVRQDGRTLAPSAAATYAYQWAEETAAGPIVVVAPPPVPKNPRVQVDAQVVGFTAFRPQPTVITRWIIVNEIEDPELEAVLDYLGVSKAVGTRFALNLAEIPSILDKLDWTDKVTLTVTKMWNHVAAGVNWATATFQSIASSIAGELFDGSSNGTLFVEAMMGALPGSPLAGDFNTLINQGEDYVKTLIRAEAVQRNDGEPVPQAEQDQADQKVAAAFDALRRAARDPQSSDRFLMPDPDGLGRAGTAYLRLTYGGVDDPAPGTSGGERDVQVRVVYRSGETPHHPNGLGHQLDLFSRSFPVPSAVLGTSFVVPVPLDALGAGYVDSDWNEAVNGHELADFVVDNRSQATRTARGDWGTHA